MKMSVTGITEYDIITGKLTVSGYLTLKWTDEFLQWQDSIFRAITKISVGVDEIWVPQVQQTSDLTDKYFFSSTWLTSDGNAAMVLAGEFAGYCDVDVVYFPLDEQTCVFSLMSTNSGSNELKFSLLKDVIDTYSLREHGEWDIIDKNIFPISHIELDIEVEFVGLVFELKLRRRPLLLLLHTTAPLVLIALLNIVIYMVPIQSGERVSFSVTILLALVFFTTNITDYVPNTSLKIPILSFIIITIITLCTINVIISVIFSRVATEKIKPVPGCLKSFVRLILKTKTGGRQVHPKEIDDSHAREGFDPEKETSDDHDEFPKSQKSLEEIEITWSMTVDIFDLIMFYVHLLVVAAGIVITTLFIINII